MSFTGVSVVTGGYHCTTSAIDTDTDSWYHLFVVKNYSHTLLEVPRPGDDIRSEHFMVGGLKWRIFYYPNGADESCSDFISFYLCLGGEEDEIEEDVEVKFQLSFIDQVEYQRPTHIHSTKTYKLSDPFGGCNRFMKRDAFDRSTHLKNGCFTIRCDILICEDFKTHDADGALSEIHDHFDDLLENKVGADVTFEVSGETFAAHRCVLAARSRVFRAQLFGPMLEGAMSSTIQIKDMEARVFTALLRFIYTDSFPEMDKDNHIEKKEEQDEEEAVKNVMWPQDLFVAADRYDLQRLKFLCENKLSEHIGVSSVASTLALPEQHCGHRLKRACFKFLQIQSPECLEEVMSTDGWAHMITTYPSLNKLVAKLVSNKKGARRERGRGCNMAPILEVTIYGMRDRCACLASAS